MYGFGKLLISIVICGTAVSAAADIYEWTDENGIKHYSNHSPPDGSTILMKTKEEPYDEAADQARMEAERRERLEMARLEIAQREIELELREAEADRRLAEADRIAQEALQEAVNYREDTSYGSRIIYRGGGYWCRDDYWGCLYPKYDRWYYRDKYRHVYHKRYRLKRHYQREHLTPYRHHRYVKKHNAYGRKDRAHKYRGNTGERHKARYNQSRLKYHTGRKTGVSRIGSGRRGYNGRIGSGRGYGGGIHSGRTGGFGRKH